MNEDQNEKLALIIGVNNRAFACTRVAWTLDRNYSIGEYNIYSVAGFFGARRHHFGCEQYSPAGAVRLLLIGNWKKSRNWMIMCGKLMRLCTRKRVRGRGRGNRESIDFVLLWDYK